MTDKKPSTTLDEYISTFPDDVQAILEKVRQSIQKAEGTTLMSLYKATTAIVK